MSQDSGVTGCSFLVNMTANYIDSTDKDATIKKKSVMPDNLSLLNFGSMRQERPLSGQQQTEIEIKPA